jgi:general secretion pathway protein F
MGAFEYQALDGRKTTRGVIQADTARSARSQLRERGLIPLEIHSVEKQTESRFSDSLVGAIGRC